MREMNNPKIGNLVYSRRQGVRHKTESKNKGLKPLLKALRNGSSIAIVADQHASTGEGVETVFFGHPARAHATPALLHLKTGIPIIVGALMRKNNGFSFDFHCTRAIEYRPTGRRDEDIRNITAMYTAELEKIIRERPGQWMWPHRRWLDINRNKKRIPKGADNNEENTCYDTQPG
jgi:KDO2-lipid IV(A) lauroyltransferase